MEEFSDKMLADWKSKEPTFYCKECDAFMYEKYRNHEHREPYYSEWKEFKRKGLI